MAVQLPTVVTAAGLQPIAPAVLRADLVTLVATTNPGYTSNLPGTLIEDIASTDVGALVLCDAARVELVNSITPYGANAFLLNQLGQVYGVPLGLASNTSVNVVFTTDPITPGYVIGIGFTVSDGTYQYVIQDGGTIGSDGTSPPLLAIANQTGTWAVPMNTVTQFITQPPITISLTLTVTNPQTGIPGAAQTDETDYRTQVLQAGLAASQGMGRYLKTLLQNVPGVQARLVSVRQQPQVLGGGWEVIVGGGDQYQVAYAIFQALFDVSTLQGSVMNVTGITNANPAVVTTQLNYGLISGTVINVTGVVGMAGINDTPLTITAITEKTFSIGIDTTFSGTYVSGGVITPNPRNVVVAVNDYPDVYQIPFVIPPQQSVHIVATWNTTSLNFVADGAIAQLAAPALIDYVNSVPVGQPMILYELQTVFQEAVADVLPPAFLTRLVFTVSINGTGVTPITGTGIIQGDPESFFFADGTSVQVTKG